MAQPRDWRPATKGSYAAIRPAVQGRLGSGREATAKPSRREVIETTVAKVGAERVGCASMLDDRVTIMIESGALLPGRIASTSRGCRLTDHDIDRPIK